MLFELVVLILLAGEIAMQIHIIAQGFEKKPEVKEMEKHREEPTESVKAEKMFSEGVLNVLNYSNPMERGKGE